MESAMRALLFANMPVIPLPITSKILQISEAKIELFFSLADIIKEKGVQSTF